MKIKTFCVLVSRIFDFYVWFPLLFVVSVFSTGLSSGQIKLLFPTLFLVQIVVPLTYFFIDLVSGRVSDIDVSKREQRFHLYIGLSVVQVIATVISYFLANDVFFAIELVNLFFALTMFLVTLFYKISGHMLLSGGYILILNFLFNWSLWWLMAALPLIAFCRLYLEKHTINQVLLGLIAGLGIPFFTFKFLGLL